MYNPTHLKNQQQQAAHAVVLHLSDALGYIRQHRFQDAYSSLLDATFNARQLPIAEHTRALTVHNALCTLIGRPQLALGVRLARDKMHEQDELARVAKREERHSDAEAHAYASRVLYSISSTCGDVSAEMALRWAADEREAQRHYPETSQEGLEAGYAATILEHLALSIRGRVS